VTDPTPEPTGEHPEPAVEHREPAVEHEAQPADDTAPASGAPATEAARTRLAELDETPLEGHVEVFEDVHRRLQEGLADLDER
jgi:hypothetical protein